jgi:quinoprotein glucose dehydrogenase
MSVLARRATWFVSLTATVVLGVGTLHSQQGGTTGQWRTYGGDLASTRYSPLDQINAANFSKLEVAWRFKTDSLGPRPEFNIQTTPLYVDGVIYATGGSRRSAYALDAATGELLWLYRMNEGKRGETAPRRLSGRGVAYYQNGNQKRVYFVTPGYQMVSIDATTGRQDPSFGLDGVVDLRRDLDQPNIDVETAEIGLHSAVIVVNGVIIVGAAHLPGTAPPAKEHIKGYIRGYDARTGKRLWIFHTIPGKGEFGNETWLNNSWEYTGNAGSWAQMSGDEQLGHVYVPVEAPTGDYYGGHRHGSNLFSSSIVALDVKTGKRVWHFQTTHHDLWDWDMPAAPVLADINVSGKPIKALALPTKQGFVYVFDRTNGQPVWPIEEKPVLQGNLPGEWYSPTQPIPTKPAPFERQGVTIDDLIDFTPDLRAKAVELVKNYTIGPLFTPPTAAVPGGNRGTLMVPSATGGVNWPGTSYDPETGIMYIYSKTEVTNLGMINDPKRSNMQYINGGGAGEGGGGLNIERLPIVKPPWGRITAINLNTGEHVWQVAHGETADEVKNNPALKGVTIPRTGRPGRIGTLTTKTLVIAGDGGVATQPNGQRGAMLRAYNKATGKEEGAVFISAPQTGSPMTYLHDGKQYLIVSISGAGQSAELVAFRVAS